MNEVIPQGWQQRKLRDFAKEVKDNNTNLENYEVLSVTKYDGFVSSLKYFKKQVYSKDTGKYKIVKKGDFAYSTIHINEGSIALLKDFNVGLISPMYTVFRIDETVDSEYLLNLLRSHKYIQIYDAIGQGSVNRRKSVPYTLLSSLDLTLPPLSEQQKITAILSSVDEAIEKTEQLVTQTEKVKKGLMQQLLTKGIGHTKFKKTAIGEIPEEWEVIPLKTIINSLKAGVSVTSENREKNKGEIGILKTSSVTNRRFDPLEHKTILPHEVSRASMNPKFDHILISRMNTEALVGASSYVDKNYDDLFLPDRLWQAEVNEDYCTLWLSYVLTSSSMRSKISNISTGTSGSMKNISKTSFLDLVVPTPKYSEQKRITDVLIKFDDKIQAESNKKEVLNMLKKGLMQQLLTGKVRVPIEDDEVVEA
ncbi:restriction endonuclease subunit S [Salimicrobium salexigens]|uniref:Type I restriction enzyme, S subunit n=1 Tax=Salimicrobium salexigens TaxID=908941 RepID=A0ABY1KXU8_9BACI|nr:restriction endonuclease subunit S [Salimicrobium salexigens]SIS90497.1 type I restriction enzyme, S subunit [Salimicrobium salexigens]